MNDGRCVYLIKNVITGRCYIGSSITPNWRIKRHMDLLRYGIHKVELMQHDYDKFGSESFISKIIGDYDDRWEALRQEVFFMKMLKTQNPEFGYNYKDKSGNSIYAIACRWRLNPLYWPYGLGQVRFNRDYPKLKAEYKKQLGKFKKNDRPDYRNVPIEYFLE